MNSNKVVIITGDRGVGKTTKISDIINLLRENSIPVAGFVAIGEWGNGERSKYTLMDIVTGKSAIICTVKSTVGYAKHGRFYFNPLAVKFGENILYRQQDSSRVVVIDEIGPFELEGKVWHNLLVYNLKNTQNILLLSVREKLIDDIIEKYNLSNVSIYNVQESSTDIVKEIIQNVI